MSIKSKTDHNTNKAAKKFNVGDWVVVATTETNDYKDVGYIVDFCFTCDERTGELYVKYLVRGIHGILLTEDCVGYYINEESLRPWTILDAKDGDVLASEDKDKVFLYNGKLDLRGRVCAYCGIYKTYDGLCFTKCAIGNYFTYKKPHPATKEQCNLLFTKMHEASYEWDAENKELNKIETKFHKGDWIVFNGLTLYVKDVVKGFYRTITKGGIPNSYDWDIDNAARLWAIQDARDGDVLVSKDGDEILIFRNLDNNTSFSSYYNINGRAEIGWSNRSFIPATKEQCDLLFTKMKEVGYVWDTEKKELKKIEPKFKIGDWITNGQLTCKVLSVTSKSYELHLYNDDYCHFETDIQSVDKDYRLWTINDAKYTFNFDKIELKMIEQKSAWSEEDEVKINRIVAYLENLNVASNDILLKDVDWLKSLKQRIGWKPTKEQINELDSTLQYSKVSHNSFESLNSLYNDLNKLTE